MTFQAFWDDHSYLSEAYAKIIYDEFTGICEDMRAEKERQNTAFNAAMSQWRCISEERDGLRLENSMLNHLMDALENALEKSKLYIVLQDVIEERKKAQEARLHP